MNGIVIDAPAPYCVVREDHFKRGYVKAEFTDIRKTFARFQHANPAHDEYDAVECLEAHEADRP